MEKKIKDINDELKNLGADFLAKKSSPKSLPSKDYFSDLKTTVFKEIDNEQNHSLSRKIWLMPLAVAAVFILGFFMLAPNSQNLNADHAALYLSIFDDEFIEWSATSSNYSSINNLNLDREFLEEYLLND